jgi:rhodanese-related sulfurtransferase
MKFSRHVMILLLLRALWSVVRGADAPEDSLDHWKATVRARYPTVPQLSTTNLASLLATHRPDSQTTNVVLLDVRSRKEFDFSHLPGARHIDPDAKPAEFDRTLAGHTGPVVVYCSVGWRSSALAQRLIDAGRTNVQNLEGSIFAWANEGRPLESKGQPTDKVHPYNRTFGRLLNPNRRGKP